MLLAFGFALTQVPEAPPYEFLRGKDGVAWPSAPPETSNAGDVQLVYTFEGDFDKVLAAARPELTAKGFYGGSMTNPPVQDYLFFEPLQPGVQHSTMVVEPVVSLHRDNVYDFDSYRLKDRRGWVTVIINNPEKPSWIESFRSWLGL